MVHYSGWRKAGLINTGLIGSLTLNIIVLFLLSQQFFSNWQLWYNSAQTPFTLYTGDCQVVSRINIALHLIIDIIASLILASGNFFMQILYSPTREDVRTAHGVGNTLEIGVQSFKNITKLGYRRFFLWVTFVYSHSSFF